MDEVAIATKWREENEYVGRGGVVIVHQGEGQGWVNKLRNPDHWVPGCVAVAEDGRTWTAIAGTEQHGALMWLPNDQITD